MNNALQQEVISMIAKELNVEDAQIDPNVPLIQYNLDSFSLFNLKFALEQKYKTILFKGYPIEEVTVNKVVDELKSL